MQILNQGRLGLALSLLTLFSNSYAEVTLDFSGLNKNQQVMNATLVLKDGYKRGKAVTPGDVVSYRLYDITGEKDSSNNWQLADIQAVINTKGQLVPAGSTSLSMHNHLQSTIFYMGSNGQWNAAGGGAELSGTSGQWTIRKSSTPAPTGVTPQSCIGGDRFHKAAAKGDVKTVQDCLNAGVAVDVKEGNGWTALHAAARQGQTQVMQILLRYGATPNVRDNTGRTPLDQAILAKQHNAINILNNYQSPKAPVAGGNKGSLPPPPAPGGAPAPGSPVQVNINDPAVVAAAEFAAADLARWRPDAMTSPYLHSIIKARKQAVAGANYYLTIKTNDTQVYTWEVVVYRDVRGNMNITESKQIQ